MSNVIKVIFSRELLLTGNVSVAFMEDLFNALPEGTKLLGFADEHNRHISSLMLQHPEFPSTSIGEMLHEAVAEWNEEEDVKFASDTLPEDTLHLLNGERMVNEGHGIHDELQEPHSMRGLNALFAERYGKAKFGEEALQSISDSYVKPDGTIEDILGLSESFQRFYNSYHSELKKPENTTCSHSWKPYTGLTESYNYCECCGEKE